MEGNHAIKRRRLEAHVGNENGKDAEEEEDYVPTLQDRVVYIPGSRTTDEVAVTIRDASTLNRDRWVTDSIISFGIDYIRQNLINRELRDKIHFCNTQFYPRFTNRLDTDKGNKAIWKRHIEKVSGPIVIRDNRKSDIFQKDYIIIPLCDHKHWYAIAIVNPAGALLSNGDIEGSRAASKCYMIVYDPASGLSGHGCGYLAWVIEIYLEMVCEKYKGPNTQFGGAHGFTYDSNRVVVVRPKNAPIQNNLLDCGIFALHFIEGMFCHFQGPIGLKDAPDFDWSRLWPHGEDNGDLGRDKIYNWLERTAGPRERSRLAKFERYYNRGLGLEGDLRRTRRHSAAAAQRKVRNENYETRFFSCDPPAERLVKEDRMFQSPRALASQKKLQLVRSIKALRFGSIY